MLKAFSVALLILSMIAVVSPQSVAESAQKIIFHVTAVRQGEAPDWCTTGECSATRFIVEGYSVVRGDLHSTEYVLECVEVMALKPSPRFTLVCDRVHANNDYGARLFADSIAFGESSPSSTGEPLHPDYKIVSEKEVNRQKR
jgi:hypothetical protein